MLKMQSPPSREVIILAGLSTCTGCHPCIMP